MRSAIDIEGVSVVYDKGRDRKVAVDDLSVQIKEGELFGLLGPNGAGKTSLISVITGLVRASEGECRVFSDPAGSISARRQIGYVPQELVHHGFFSVSEILHYFSGYYGLSGNHERIDILLDRLALSDVRHKKVNTLSGGMKRRLLICKALVHSPKILLLDEPSAGVDVELRSELWQFVQELNQQGTTILLTTHYLEEAQRLCNRVGIMHHGKLIALDETKNLISSLAERILIFKLKEDAETPALRTTDHRISLRKLGPNEWELRFQSGVLLNEAIENIGVEWGEIEDFRMESGALEDVFLKLVKASSL